MHCCYKALFICELFHHILAILHSTEHNSYLHDLIFLYLTPSLKLYILGTAHWKDEVWSLQRLGKPAFLRFTGASVLERASGLVSDPQKNLDTAACPEKAACLEGL